jgi:hypothetical protein
MLLCCVPLSFWVFFQQVHDVEHPCRVKKSHHSRFFLQNEIQVEIQLWGLDFTWDKNPNNAGICWLLYSVSRWYSPQYYNGSLTWISTNVTNIYLTSIRSALHDGPRPFKVEANSVKSQPKWPWNWGKAHIKLRVDMESILPCLKVLGPRSNGHKHEALTISAHLLSFITFCINMDCENFILSNVTMAPKPRIGFPFWSNPILIARAVSDHVLSSLFYSPPISIVISHVKH